MGWFTNDDDDNEKPKIHFSRTSSSSYTSCKQDPED